MLLIRKEKTSLINVLQNLSNQCLAKLTKILIWSSNNRKMKWSIYSWQGDWNLIKNVERIYGRKGLTLSFGNWLNNSHKQMEEINKLRAEVTMFPIIVKRPQHIHPEFWCRTELTMVKGFIIHPSIVYLSSHPIIHPIGLTTSSCHYLIFFFYIKGDNFMWFNIKYSVNTCWIYYYYIQRILQCLGSNAWMRNTLHPCKTPVEEILTNYYL